MMLQILQILIAIDQVFNAILGGWADETLSSRAYRTMPNIAKFIDTILWFDKDHCYESYVSEQLRVQFPPELR
jgi:hypothetical protein